jgi:hypothetical protein
MGEITMRKAIVLVAVAVVLGGSFAARGPLLRYIDSFWLSGIDPRGNPTNPDNTLTDIYGAPARYDSPRAKGPSAAPPRPTVSSDPLAS